MNCNTHEKCERDGCIKCCTCGAPLRSEVDRAASLWDALQLSWASMSAQRKEIVVELVTEIARMDIRDAQQLAIAARRIV